ncbi:MAG: hypothetical protein GY801_23830 [bacterium]|nr:hypothetical protein [bacterium]
MPAHNNSSKNQSLVTVCVIQHKAFELEVTSVPGSVDYKERERLIMAKRIGEYLVDSGVLSEARLKEALELQEDQKGFLGQILLEKGWVTDTQLCQGISEILDVNYVSIENVLISEEVTGLISNSLAVTCQILPLFVHDNIVYLAMENPRDAGVIQLVEYETGMQVKPLISPPRQLGEMIARYYQIDESTEQESERLSEKNRVELGKKITREIGFGQRKRLGDLLIEAGLLTQEQIDTALQLQKGQKGFLGKLIVDMGWVTEEDVCQALSDMLRIESVNLDDVHIDPEAKKYIPDSLAASSNIFPLFMEDDTLYLAMENPLDSGVLLYLRYSTEMEIEPLVAPPGQIRAVIQKYYSSQSANDSQTE